MITIHKYPFMVKDKVSVVIPGHVFTLKVAAQHPESGQLCLWAIVDTESEEIERVHLRVVETGYPFGDYDDEKLHFVDTVMDGQYVWHIFQITDEQEATDAR